MSDSSHDSASSSPVLSSSSSSPASTGTDEMSSDQERRTLVPRLPARPTNTTTTTQPSSTRPSTARRAHKSRVPKRRPFRRVELSYDVKSMFGIDLDSISSEKELFEQILKLQRRMRSNLVTFVPPPPPRIPSWNERTLLHSKLMSIQACIDSLQYNHLGLEFNGINKTESMKELYSKARSMLHAARPVKCLEAVVLAIYLARDLLEEVDLFPVRFQSCVSGKLRRLLDSGSEGSGDAQTGSMHCDGGDGKSQRNSTELDCDSGQNVGKGCVDGEAKASPRRGTSVKQVGGLDTNGQTESSMCGDGSGGDADSDEKHHTHKVSNSNQLPASTPQSLPQQISKPEKRTSKSAQTHWHIVLVVRSRRTSAFGSLGISRQPTLAYKSCSFSTFSSLLGSFRQAYNAVGHFVLRVTVGLPVVRVCTGLERMRWQDYSLPVPKSGDWVGQMRAADRFMLHFAGLRQQLRTHGRLQDIEGVGVWSEQFRQLCSVPISRKGVGDDIV